MITSVPKTTGPVSKDQLTSSKSGTSKMALNPQDFIQMMITQLQNQDPTQPASNDQLLAQMSQIGQLQSSTQLQDSLKGMVKQNQIGSASALIGKTVQGLDVNNDPVGGTVSSVSVKDDGVTLQLDNGVGLDLSRVTSIAPTNPPTTPVH